MPSPDKVEVTTSTSIPAASQRQATEATEMASILRTAGQRRVNLIWEMTQAVIALAVSGTTLFVSSRLAVQVGVDKTAFVLLSNAFFLVVGFYFGRTNHQRTGGVGASDAGR